MAGITLNQIALQIVSEQGEHVGDDAFVAQCEIWLKDALIEIDSEANFKAFAKDFSIVTAVSIALYNLPEDFRAIKYLRMVDTDEEIDYINPKTLTQYGIDLEQSGRPRNHWVSDPVINVSNQFIQRVRLHPVPNGVLTINGMYYFDVINLISGSFIPLTQRAMLTLKSRLRMYIAKGDREWTAYNVERGQYAKDLAALLREETNKPSRNLTARPTDLPLRSRRPSRLRYPFE